MITQNQARELYERLSDMTGIIDEEAQHAYFCSNWLRIDNGIEKLCSRRCPARAETTVPHCLIDDARALVERMENEECNHNTIETG